MNARIELRMADITLQEVDVIVNAANSHLVHGGGVAAAIARAAGPALAAESAEVPFVETGDARATTAGDLPCKYVIHSVGPVWSGGGAGEPELLASAYLRAVEVADQLGCTSMALPSISTGIFGFPIELAATIALESVSDALARAESVGLARFCLFSEPDLSQYRRAAQATRIKVHD